MTQGTLEERRPFIDRHLDWGTDQDNPIQDPHRLAAMLETWRIPKAEGREQAVKVSADTLGKHKGLLNHTVIHQQPRVQ